MSVWSSKAPQGSDYKRSFSELGVFAIQIYMLLLVETGEYALGEDNAYLLPEDDEQKGLYKPGTIKEGIYGQY